MKKLQSILLVLFATASLLSGCKKTTTPDDGGSGNLAAGKSQISCNYAGAATGSFSSASLVSTAIKNASLMNISGGTTTLPIQLMLFVIPTNITVGSHNLSTSSEFTVSLTKDATGWAAGNSGDNFTLVVTKNDGTYFEGTFSGTLTNDTDHTSVTITNGKIAARF